MLIELGVAEQRHRAVLEVLGGLISMGRAVVRVRNRIIVKETKSESIRSAWRVVVIRSERALGEIARQLKTDSVDLQEILAAAAHAFLIARQGCEVFLPDDRMYRMNAPRPSVRET